MIDGIAQDVHCIGTAKTMNGRIQITGDSLQVEQEESVRPSHARFEQRPVTSGDAEDREIHIYCETKNGAIRVRA
jgi:hypothetical protein